MVKFVVVYYVPGVLQNNIVPFSSGGPQVWLLLARTSSSIDFVHERSEYWTPRLEVKGMRTLLTHRKRELVWPLSMSRFPGQATVTILSVWLTMMTFRN